MSLKWDADKGGRDNWIAWMQTVASECFRVLKHGGYAFVWALPRTSSWTATAWENAGFTVRDCVSSFYDGDRDVANFIDSLSPDQIDLLEIVLSNNDGNCSQILYHIFGSGFPKSLSVGKEIDKLQANGNSKNEELEFVQWLKQQIGEKSISDIDETLGFKNRAFHFFAESDSNRHIPSNEQYLVLKQFLKLDDSFDEFVKRKNLQLVDIREVRGYEESIKSWNKKYTKPILDKPLSMESQRYTGFGTNLKPAAEHWLLFRKPLEKGLTVAENVLKHGCGSINIDGCRIKTSDNTGRQSGLDSGMWSGKKQMISESNTGGRWPANVILSHSEGCRCVGTKKIKAITGGCTKFGGSFGNSPEHSITSDQKDYADSDGNETVEDWICVEGCAVRLLDQQSGITKSGKVKNNKDAYDGESTTKFIRGVSNQNNQHGDSGGVSRFFYIAKPSRSERNFGLDNFESKDRDVRGNNQAIRVCVDCGLTDNGALNDHSKCSGNFEYRQCKPTANTHPTIKSVSLMKNLVRLVTPPNGIVLDPFAGSGTTGIACKLEGFNAVLIDSNQEYVDIGRARIEAWQPEEECGVKKVKNKVSKVVEKEVGQPENNQMQMF